MLASFLLNEPLRVLPAKTSTLTSAISAFLSVALVGDACGRSTQFLAQARQFSLLFGRQSADHSRDLRSLFRKHLRDQFPALGCEMKREEATIVGALLALHQPALFEIFYHQR